MEKQEIVEISFDECELVAGGSGYLIASGRNDDAE
jgi:hypothetical protein